MQDNIMMSLKEKDRSRWTTTVDGLVLFMKKIIRPRQPRKQYNSGQDDRWSRKLPYDIMELIFRRLPMSDQHSCRHVCPGWRAVIDSKRCLPADHQLPWLLRDNCQSFYIKSNENCFVSDRKAFKSDFPWPGRSIGSIEGWLIILDTCNNEKLATFFFLNPVSGARIMLPSHSAPKWFYRIKKVVASSVPMTSTRLQKKQRRVCYVCCLHLVETGRLAFCTPTDTSWTDIGYFSNLNKELFREVEIVDGKLYAIGGARLFSELMVIDIQIDSRRRGAHTWTKERLVNLDYPNFSTLRTRDYYLVKGCDSSKDLFMLLREQGVWPGDTTGFKVWKFEYKSHRWIEMVELGDQVLFVAGMNMKFVSSHDNSLEKDSIYFTSPLHHTGNYGVFSLTTRGIKPLSFPKEQSNGSEWNETVWFTPNPW